MSKKYVVDYSSRNKALTGFYRKEFSTKEEAINWVDKEPDLYWHRIRNQKAKSKLKKLVVTDAVDLSQYKRIDGVLERYFETGMECVGLVLSDKTKFGPPNPNFDPSKPEDGRNFKNYADINSIHFLGHGDILQPEGQLKFLLIKDRSFAADDGYTLSLYPQGFSREELVKLFFSEKTKATVWVKKKRVEV
jgi:hypothetical protein